MAITIDGSNLTFNNGTFYDMRRPTYHNVVSLSGTTGATITGIPADAQTIWINLWNLKTNGTEAIRLLYANGSGTTSTYYGGSANMTTGVIGALHAAGGISLLPAGNNTTNYTWFGIIELNRLVNLFHGYTANWVMGSVATTVRTAMGYGFGSGLSNADITSIRIQTNSVNTFTSGEFTVTYA